MIGKEFSDDHIRGIIKTKMYMNDTEMWYGYFLYCEIANHGDFNFTFNSDLIDFLKGEYKDLDVLHCNVCHTIKSDYYNGKLNLDRWLQEAVHRDLIPNGNHYSIDIHVDAAIMLYFRYMVENYITNDLIFVACINIMNDIQLNYGFNLSFADCQRLIDEYKKIPLKDILNTPNILKQTVLKCFPELELKKIESNDLTKLNPNEDFDVNLQKTEGCTSKFVFSDDKSMIGVLNKEGYFVSTK